MIQVEEEGVSFIFSCWHMCYYRQEVSSSWRLLTVLGWVPPTLPSASLILNDVIWPWLDLLHRAKLISTPINTELKRGFKYLTAAVNNTQWITLEVHVFFLLLHHTLSLVIGSYSCRIVQCDDGNAAANAHPLPVWASLSHKAAVQPIGGIISVCVDRYCSSKPSGVHTLRADVFIWAFAFFGLFFFRQVTTKTL